MTTTTSSYPTSSPAPDASFTNQGSIWLLQLLTPAAVEWAKEHCPDDGDHQYHCGALVVEKQYVADIFDLATRDGLIVSGY
jgi:hypothetical protein